MPTPEQSKTGYYTHTIIDPDKGVPDRVVVLGRLSRETYNYFFRQVLPSTSGPRQAMISIFFNRFREACLESGIKPEWSEDNEAKVNEVLQRLNFNIQRGAVSKKVK